MIERLFSAPPSLRIGLCVWALLAANFTGAQSTQIHSNEPRALVGKIEGLESHGLVLTDGQGNLLRPHAGAKEFQFLGGKSEIDALDNIQLKVARQPIGQTCRIAHEFAQVRDSKLQSTVACVNGPLKPTSMRDCFRVPSSGSTYRLGQMVDAKWTPFAEVTMDPIGVNRMHHRTLKNGRLVLESITHFPEDRPWAVIEILAGSAVKATQISERSEKVEGIPLDLAIGEERHYVAANFEQALQPPKLTRASAPRRLKLVSIGPLETQAGRFLATCHLQERYINENGSTELWDVWYAPGYGPVRIQESDADGRPTRLRLEAIEILRSPR